MTIRSIPIRDIAVGFKLYRPEESSIHIHVRRDNTVYGLGQEIIPTITVTNTGTRTLTDITLVSDALNFDDIIVNSLSSGQSYTYTMSGYSYLVDEATILDGDGLIVDFSVTAIDTLGDEITDSTTSTYSIESPRSTLSVVFTPDLTEYSAGDKIYPEITITNTGNLTLYNVICISNLTASSTSLSNLAPGDSDVITIGFYNVTSSDVTAGSVYCDATVTADTPDPDNPDVSCSDAYLYRTALQLIQPTMTLTATDSTPSNNHTISVSGTLPSDATGTVTIYLATGSNASNVYLTNPTTVSILNGQFSCTYTTSRAYYVVAIYDGDSKYEGARVETTSMAYVNYAFTIGVDTNTVDLSEWGSVTAAWGLYGYGSSESEVTYGTETLDENNYVYQNSGILVPTHEIRPNGTLMEIDYYVRLDTNELEEGLDVAYDDDNHVVRIYSDLIIIDDPDTPL